MFLVWIELQNQQWRYDSFKTYCTIKLSVLPSLGRTFQQVRRKNSQNTEYTECQAFFPVVRTMGYPHPQCSSPSSKGGDTLAFGGEGGGANSDEGTDTLVLYGIPLRPKLNICLHATVYSIVYWTVYAPALVLLNQRLSWIICCTV
jgi:hypothetical protein